MNDPTQPYLEKIMSSPGWYGTVVIEAKPEGVQVWWRSDAQVEDIATSGLVADSEGETVLEALRRAAEDAEALE